MADVTLSPADPASLAIVRLRVPMTVAETAMRSLALPGALRAHVDTERTALWLGPDQWLLVSERVAACELVRRCSSALEGRLHLAVDASAATQRIGVGGAASRALLSMGCGLDWGSVDSTPVGYATRTRFAGIGVVVHVATAERIDLYCDRSQRDHLDRWLRRSVSDPLLRELRCPNTY